MSSNAEVKRALLAAPMRKGKKRMIAQLSDWADYQTGVIIPRFARRIVKLADAIDLGEDTTRKLLAEAVRDGWWEPATPDPARPDRVVMGTVTIPQDVALLVKLGRVATCQYERCGPPPKILTGRRADAKYCCTRHRMAAMRLEASRNSQRTLAVTAADDDLAISRNAVTPIAVTDLDASRNKPQVTGTSTTTAAGQISVERVSNASGQRRADIAPTGNDPQLQEPGADGGCDHRYRGQPPHDCIRCGEVAVSVPVPAVKVSGPELGPINKGGCLFGSGSLWCIRPECANPHHRQRPAPEDSPLHYGPEELTGQGYDRDRIADLADAGRAALKIADGTDRKDTAR